MATVGMNSRSDLSFQQNLAHNSLNSEGFFAALRTSCQRLDTHRWTPRPFAFCPVRDPHSCRSVPEKGQPVSFCAFCAEKCRNFLIALAESALKVDLLAIEIRNKGTKTCLRKLGSSQQLLHSLSRVAWKQICSVALLAQPLVRLLQMRLAQTKRRQHLQAQLLAFCATTQASAARHAKTFRATLARHTIMNSRQGPSLAAVLRSKDTAYA
ncbi:MAG: hypothetical protein ABJC34_07200 [Marinomonas sp.]